MALPSHSCTKTPPSRSCPVWGKAGRTTVFARSPLRRRSLTVGSRPRLSTVFRPVAVGAPASCCDDGLFFGTDREPGPDRYRKEPRGGRMSGMKRRRRWRLAWGLLLAPQLGCFALPQGLPPLQPPRPPAAEAAKTLPLRESADLCARIDDGMTQHGHLPEASLQRSEEHTSELQSLRHLVCRLLLEK